MSVDWADIAHEFQPDGGMLLDIHVRPAARDDWQRVLDMIRSRFANVSYRVDGETAALPLRADEIFAVKSRAAPSLGFDLNGVSFATHFFSPDEIELDLNPDQVRGPDGLLAVAAILEGLAHATGKMASLTPESMPDNTILSYDPHSSRLAYHPPAERPDQ